MIPAGKRRLVAAAFQCFRPGLLWSLAGLFLCMGAFAQPAVGGNIELSEAAAGKSDGAVSGTGIFSKSDAGILTLQGAASQGSWGVASRTLFGAANRLDVINADEIGIHRAKVKTSAVDIACRLGSRTRLTAVHANLKGSGEDLPEGDLTNQGKTAARKVYF